jgi:hypothetical protein
MYNKVLIVKLDKALGYEYFIDYAHPLATGNSGRVYLHRHIASLKVKRWLTANEHVHHMDEDKTNNTEDNLVILTAEEHHKIHNQTDRITKVCPVCDDLFTVVPSHSHAVNCSAACAGIACTKVFISKEELEPKLWYMTAQHLGKIYGLSDKGIIKKAKSLGCKMPPPYFHNKSEKFKHEQRKLNNM